jgi:hypothetical protein
MNRVPCNSSLWARHHALQKTFEPLAAAEEPGLTKHAHHSRQICFWSLGMNDQV